MKYFIRKDNKKFGNLKLVCDNFFIKESMNIKFLILLLFLPNLS